jgi:hypothetical protein
MVSIIKLNKGLESYKGILNWKGNEYKFLYLFNLIIDTISMMYLFLFKCRSSLSFLSFDVFDITILSIKNTHQMIKKTKKNDI